MQGDAGPPFLCIMSACAQRMLGPALSGGRMRVIPGRTCFVRRWSRNLESSAPLISVITRDECAGGVEGTLLRMLGRGAGPRLHQA